MVRTTISFLLALSCLLSNLQPMVKKREQPAATLTCGLCQALSSPSLLPQPHLPLLRSQRGSAHAQDKVEDGLIPRDGLEVTVLEVTEVPSN